MIEQFRKNAIYFLLGIYALFSVVTIIYFDGTCDSGDSIHHYLIAKYALKHPELFFDHWGKPVYTLLASPFAQFGFTGVKVFNALVSLTTIYFTFSASVRLQMKNNLVATIMLAFMPLFYILTFSGLTEPLFALFLVTGLYCCVRQKYILAALIISFLPFVRSEGLILVGVFGFYFLLKKHFKPIIFLATGHAIYSLAGYFIHHDLLWVFNKIPYANSESGYGSGTLNHFVIQLYYVVGLPLYVLLGFGLVGIIVQMSNTKNHREELILIILGFVCFFIAHTLFWYFGIFNSMGLKRVFVGIAPFIALLSLIGYDFLLSFLKPSIIQRILSIILVLCVIVFPFTTNPAAVNRKDLVLKDDQLTAKEVARYIDAIRSNNQRLVYYAPYLSELLDIDHFDSEQQMDLTRENLHLLKTGDVIIWDNWFAVVDGSTSDSALRQNSELKFLREFKNADNDEISYKVYIRN